MFCPQCGTDQKNEAKFCHNCGNKHITDTALSGGKSTDNKNSQASRSRSLSIGLFLAIFIFFGGIYSILKSPGQEKTPPSTAYAKPAPIFIPEEAQKTVNKFFNLLDRRDYPQAYAMFSSNKQKSGTLDEWKKGYQNTISHTINMVNCFDLSCTINLTATESSSANMRRVTYEMRYYFIFDASDNLKIDRTTFISQNIDEIIKTYNSGGGTDSSLFGSFVKIICTEPNFEEISQGSGTVIAPDTVLTNLHVSLGYPDFCLAKRVDSNGQLTGDVYFLDYSITENESYDFWTFHMQRKNDNLNENPLPLPLKPCTSKQIQIGDSIRTYGFPGASGASLTVTDGIISGLDTVSRGMYITSAKIDHGNSGGTAINTSKNCFLGIPTIGRRGELESYGGILGIPTILEVQPDIFSLTTIPHEATETNSL